MAEIRYYGNIGPPFTDKYVKHDIAELISTNGKEIVCKFGEDRESQLTLHQVYAYVLSKTHDPLHFLVKMGAGKIQAIAIFRLVKDLKTLYIEYLCSIEKGTGSELLGILKQLVIEKDFQSITLESVKGALGYYIKEQFHQVEPPRLFMKWDAPKGGRRTKRTKRRRRTRK